MRRGFAQLVALWCLVGGCGHESPCLEDTDCPPGQLCGNGSCASPSAADAALSEPGDVDAAVPAAETDAAADTLEAGPDTSEELPETVNPGDAAEPPLPECFVGLPATPLRGDYIRAVLAGSDGVVVAGQVEDGTDGTETTRGWLAWFDAGGALLNEAISEQAATRSLGGLAWRDPDTVLGTGVHIEGSDSDQLWITSARRGEGFFDQHVIGGGWHERGYSVVPLASGGWYVVGDTSTFGGLYWSGWLVPLDQDALPSAPLAVGDATVHDQLNSATAAPGGTLVVGWRGSELEGNKPRRAWWALVADDQKVTWEHTWEDYERGTLHAAACADSGVCAVAGEEKPGRAGLVLLLGEGGEAVWKRHYGKEDGGALRALVALDGGEWAAAGEIEAAGHLDAWFLRLDAQGDVLAERRWGTERSERVMSMVRLGPERLLVGGRIEPSPDDPLLEILDRDGQPPEGCLRLRLSGD